MKYVLAILLSLSLYAPDVAKLVAYTDYVVDAVTDKEMNICDCEPILEKQSSEHKDHHFIVKTDWTYLATDFFYLKEEKLLLEKEYQFYKNQSLPEFSSTIFQPPQV